MVMTPSRNSILCPNCRKLISSDEKRCPFCGIRTPGSMLKNNPLTRHWGNGEHLVKWIIYTNVTMYLISLLIDPQKIGLGFNPLTALSPSINSLAALGATGARLIYKSQGWWTLITANYLHGSILHIVFNLIALYQLSPLITQLYGPYRFFIIFTFSGVFGFWISYLAGVQVNHRCLGVPMRFDWRGVVFRQNPRGPLRPGCLQTNRRLGLNDTDFRFPGFRGQQLGSHRRHDCRCLGRPIIWLSRKTAGKHDPSLARRWFCGGHGPGSGLGDCEGGRFLDQWIEGVNPWRTDRCAG